jgi:ankyrin repeat protein
VENDLVAVKHGLAARADVDTEWDGQSALMHALASGSPQGNDIGRELMDRSADVNRRQAGCSPLVLASQRSPPELCRRLIEKGAMVNAIFDDPPYCSALNVSVAYQRPEITSILLEYGASVDVSYSVQKVWDGPKRVTPQRSNWPKLPDGSTVIWRDMTPLHNSIMAGNTRLVELLLRVGADPEAVLRGRNDQKYTALEVAELFGRDELADLLRKRQ